VIAWIAQTWQRVRTSGGVLPSTITVPRADHRQPATDPVKVLVNALRAARRVVGALIRWLVARTTALPAAVMTMVRLPSHRSTPRNGNRSGYRGSNGPRNPESPRGSGSRSAICSKSLRTPEIVIPRSTNPSNSQIFRRWAPQQPTTDFFRAK
jgi:hypothetical protein